MSVKQYLRSCQVQYIREQVWECKTGAEKEHDAEGTAPSQSTKLSQDKASPSDGAVGSAAGNKQAPQVDLSQRRKDYVEVWTCNTGNKVLLTTVISKLLLLIQIDRKLFSIFRQKPRV